MMEAWGYRPRGCVWWVPLGRLCGLDETRIKKAGEGIVRKLGSSLVTLVGLMAVTHPALAQATAQSAVQWTVQGEVGASVFFGNRDQTTLTSRAQMERADSSYEFSTKADFAYGEAEDDAGTAFVNKRSWSVGSNVDYHPFSRVSPFIFGTVQSSFEKKIDLRYDAGAGGKVNIVRNDVSRVDFRGALLVEQTRPADSNGGGEDETLARWLGVLRVRRTLDDGRVTFESETQYQPVFDAFDNFTIDFEGSVAFELSEVISLKLSLVDKYDSGAKDRGARTNNDGQLFFSVLSSF